MRRLATVRVRAALSAALAAAICFSAGALWLRHVIYADRMAATIQSARMQALGIGATYESPQAGSFAEAGALAKDPSQGQFQITYSGEGFPFLAAAYAVVDSHGRLLLVQQDLAYYVRDRGLKFPASPPEDDFGAPGFTGHVRLRLPVSVNGERRHQLDGREVTLATRTVGNPAKATVYVLASPLDAENAVGAVDPWLIGGLPAAVLLVAAVAWVTAGRALRPVERMRAELARITAADPSGRVPQPRTRDEIGRLAVTMNATLDRLADAIDRQRRFVADAAHELRSPLAGLRSTVEVALEHGEAADLNAVKSTTERLQHLTDDLLLLARLERTPPGNGEPVDVSEVAQELVAERRYRQPPDERFAVVTDGPAPITGRERELSRMLRNLLDNASRYARERVVVLVSRPEPGLVRVEVRDDGPGIPQADRERVFERFARIDEARDRGHGGAGLGLAIARDIAVRHGGRLYAADSADGARFVAELPQSPRT